LAHHDRKQRKAPSSPTASDASTIPMKKTSIACSTVSPRPCAIRGMKSYIPTSSLNPEGLKACPS